jgi:hypothetical protein
MRMVTFVETDELRAEAEQLAEGVIQALVKKAQRYCRSKNLAKQDHLDEGAYINNMIAMLGLDRLDRYELSHIQALIYYISRNQGIKEETVCHLLQKEMKVSKVENIQRQNYCKAVDFLRDMEHSGHIS